MSVGECQRVAVVRALIKRTQVVLADEPTGSLDRDSAETLIEMLINLKNEYGFTLLQLLMPNICRQDGTQVQACKWEITADLRAMILKNNTIPVKLQAALLLLSVWLPVFYFREGIVEFFIYRLLSLEKESVVSQGLNFSYNRNQNIPAVDSGDIS
jgi:hypothetical protein